MANAYGPYSTSNTLGVNLDERYPAENSASFPVVYPPPHALGTPVLGTDNSTWVFVVADVPVTANQTAVTINANFHITAASGGNPAYTNTTAFAAGESGWVKRTTSSL